MKKYDKGKTRENVREIGRKGERKRENGKEKGKTNPKREALWQKGSDSSRKTM